MMDKIESVKRKNNINMPDGHQLENLLNHTKLLASGLKNVYQIPKNNIGFVPQEYEVGLQVNNKP